MIKADPVVRHVDIVGYGRLGKALAHSLSRAGASVRVWTPTVRGRGGEGIGVFEGEKPSGFPSGEIVLLAVSDRAIEAVAEDLEVREGQIVAHLSGAAGLDVLRSASSRGAEVGSLHPLLAVPAGAASLPEGFAAVDGSDEARRALEELARAIGLLPFHVPAEMRAVYHAAASLAANGLVALAGLAADLFGRMGMGRAEAVQALVPLLGAAVEGLASRGLPGALTGPVCRGDVETVRRHLEAIAGTSAERSYRALMTCALALSRELGEADEAALEAIASLLNER